MILFLKLNEPYGFFSNFSNHPIMEDNIFYKTSEHYYQSYKFYDDKNRMEIIQAFSPKLAAEKGRDKSRPLRADWEYVKDKIMFSALLLKSSQHPIIRDALLATGDEEIGEASLVDFYWALGSDGTGKNKLGKMWMTIRELYRNHLS
jgi:ribA/ribD-fused uncharacterized protein